MKVTLTHKATPYGVPEYLQCDHEGCEVKSRIFWNGGPLLYEGFTYVLQGRNVRHFCEKHTPEGARHLYPVFHF